MLKFTMSLNVNFNIKLLTVKNINVIFKMLELSQILKGLSGINSHNFTNDFKL